MRIVKVVLVSRQQGISSSSVSSVKVYSHLSKSCMDIEIGHDAKTLSIKNKPCIKKETETDSLENPMSHSVYNMLEMLHAAFSPSCIIVTRQHRFMQSIICKV